MGYQQLQENFGFNPYTHYTPQTRPVRWQLAIYYSNDAKEKLIYNDASMIEELKGMTCGIRHTFVLYNI